MASQARPVVGALPQISAEGGVPTRVPNERPEGAAGDHSGLTFGTRVGTSFLAKIEAGLSVAGILEVDWACRPVLFPGVPCG